VVSSPADLAAAKEQLFMGKPLEQLGRSEPGAAKECPPPPKP